MLVSIFKPHSFYCLLIGKEVVKAEILHKNNSNNILSFTNLLFGNNWQINVAFKLVSWNNETRYGRCISLHWRTITKHVPSVWASLRDSDFPRASASLGHCHNKLVYQSQGNTACLALTWAESESFCNLLWSLDTLTRQHKIAINLKSLFNIDWVRDLFLCELHQYVEVSFG